MKITSSSSSLLGAALGLALLALPTAPAVAEPSPSAVNNPAALVFDFKGDQAMNGWGKTSTTTVKFNPEFMGIQGNGWDSKLFRGIKLPAGYYNLSACGKGRVLSVTLRNGWDYKKAPVLDVNLARDEWRTDWRPFRLTEPLNDGVLLVNVGDKGLVDSAMKWIKIEPAAEVAESNIPSVAELEKMKPVPAVVRGCTLLDKNSLGDLRQWGANVTRYVMRLKPDLDKQGLASYPEGWENEQLKPVEEYLQEARAKGMKVVIFLDGNSFADQYAAESYGFWSDPGLAPLMCKVWQKIVVKLKPYRDVIWGYDLFNEPLDRSQMPNPPRQWREIAKEVIKTIRAEDKDTWIIYETGPGGLTWGFAGMKPLPDNRVIYSGHFYSPHEFTHQGIYDLRGTDLAEVQAKLNVRYPGTVNGLYWNKDQIKKSLEPVREFQLKYHVPILIGEFSAVRWAPKPDTEMYLRDVIEICEEYQWSWIYHGFREWHGWSVEHDEKFAQHDVAVPPAAQETNRARIIKAGLNHNNNQ